MMNLLLYMWICIINMFFHFLMIKSKNRSKYKIRRQDKINISIYQTQYKLCIMQVNKNKVIILMFIIDCGLSNIITWLVNIFKLKHKIKGFFVYVQTKKYQQVKKNKLIY
ncbi:hypothetical protein EDEG_04139 [Edhazardia aedis USNM 41457]|uniref:Transmembrane protein n=1 Tax=Edhazardia aedis (strain USNM 41457) TaxID=1003232 RepID=J9DB66_EDHAE|nr:hypothetical protein EDEG_04139 [Edhazardia aedis USNM 41457]|eukprot:EJW05001.1 hypothetical protein EDEG_04139 [Edhazardia aedis USNM 41457]